MTLYHFKENQEINIKNLDDFLREFARKKSPLTSLPLCRIGKEWQDFADNDNRSELPLPEGQRLPRGNPPPKPGIYAIFARKSRSHRPLCFHVGISSNDIRGRLRTRLYKNVEENYRNAFGTTLQPCSRNHASPSTTSCRLPHCQVIWFTGMCARQRPSLSALPR